MENQIGIGNANVNVNVHRNMNVVKALVRLGTPKLPTSTHGKPKSEQKPTEQCNGLTTNVIN